ncbi:DUF6221 family protein [Streptomyces mirabilis]|uniref:DUF6221 family protein n=1 Tax=Streptomyces mirabilis TaxID=68239 RepID=UPI0036C3F365
MSEIADFLRARYKQEAHVARLITETTGSEHWKADWRQLSYNHFDARVIAGPDNPVLDGYGSVGTAEFVSGYSPARVLADLDAKLALVDDLLAERHYVNDGDCWYTCAAAAEESDGGETCDDNRRGGRCDCGRDARVNRRLAILAQPFAGHPDHKGEEWAP